MTLQWVVQEQPGAEVQSCTVSIGGKVQEFGRQYCNYGSWYGTISELPQNKILSATVSWKNGNLISSLGYEVASAMFCRASPLPR